MHGWMKHTAPFKQELHRAEMDERERVLRLIRGREQYQRNRIAVQRREDPDGMHSESVEIVKAAEGALDTLGELEREVRQGFHR